MIFFAGSWMSLFLNVALILSFASLMVVSGSQIISIVGKALLASTSITTLYACNPIPANVEIF